MCLAMLGTTRYLSSFFFSTNKSRARSTGKARVHTTELRYSTTSARCVLGYNIAGIQQPLAGTTEVKIGWSFLSSSQCGRPSVRMTTRTKVMEAVSRRRHLAQQARALRPDQSHRCSTSHDEPARPLLIFCYPVSKATRKRLSVWLAPQMAYVRGKTSACVFLET